MRQRAETDEMSGAIIMLHGVGGTGETWSRFAPAFRAKGWRVETPTLRPDKRLAENPPADLPSLRLKDYVADIAALAKAIEAETGVAPVLVGHSMGGWWSRSWPRWASVARRCW